MWLVLRAIVGICADVVRLGVLFLRSASPIRGENLVLRKQLARYIERGVKPRRVDQRTLVYVLKPQPGRSRGDQRWSTFLKNHAKAIVACDFFVSVTATFRVLYVFIVIEHRRRRLAHVNPLLTGRCRNCERSSRKWAFIVI
jgi:hypothetical protein